MLIDLNAVTGITGQHLNQTITYSRFKTYSRF